MTATFTEIEATWAAEFPTASALILILRAALAFADWQARRIQSDFHQLHRDLHLTGLPMPLWDPETRQTFRFMEKANSSAQREFHRALTALQSNYKKPEPLKSHRRRPTRPARSISSKPFTSRWRTAWSNRPPKPTPPSSAPFRPTNSK